MAGPEDVEANGPAGLIHPNGSTGGSPEGALDRLTILLGPTAIDRLGAARVAVVGLGAVGYQALEALARSGVGHLRIVDCDRLHPSNLNRQLLALHSTIGRWKVEVAAERLADINPDCKVQALRLFADQATLPVILGPWDSPEPAGAPLDLVIDAIDSLHPKATLIAGTVRAGVPILTCLGAARRLEPERIRCGDLFKSKHCPLARQLRKRLRRLEIQGPIPAVYSDEPCGPHGRRPLEPAGEDDLVEEAVGIPSIPDEDWRGRPRETLGSMATITGLFGLWVAHSAIRLLLTGHSTGQLTAHETDSK